MTSTRPTRRRGAKAHELGLMNLHVPESPAGSAFHFDGILVGEELNWGCSGTAPRSARTACSAR